MSMVFVLQLMANCNLGEPLLCCFFCAEDNSIEEFSFEQ
jgi:hypothetical protein